ncbi:MAG: hypothetical protein EZS28_008495 [Streblomastix strix]|uniref:Uncharacterized protein n=1 Tax=Streblomastix strix TaxID=222440 RepID=A0A5J4WLX8_9EUKA|nr:MAG: hypothetical protein EZS28_008495 [Streblomastix strix]
MTTTYKQTLNKFNKENTTYKQRMAEANLDIRRMLQTAFQPESVQIESIRVVLDHEGKKIDGVVLIDNDVNKERLKRVQNLKKSNKLNLQIPFLDTPKYITPQVDIFSPKSKTQQNIMKLGQIALNNIQQQKISARGQQPVVSISNRLDNTQSVQLQQKEPPQPVRTASSISKTSTSTRSNSMSLSSYGQSYEDELLFQRRKSLQLENQNDNQQSQKRRKTSLSQMFDESLMQSGQSEYSNDSQNNSGY